MNRKSYQHAKAGGFTLIELLLSMVISTIIVAAVYAAYTSQQDSYLAQDQVAEMQQNLRAGIELMMSDIRMAGYDSHETAGSTITAATATTITFNRDIYGGDSDGEDNDKDGVEDEPDEAAYGDGTINADGSEDVQYAIWYERVDDTGDISVGLDGQWNGVTPGVVDVDLDSNPDAGTYVFTLARTHPDPVIGGWLPIAENIEAIEFYYTLDGITTPTLNPTPGTEDDIRTIQIALLARADMADPDFTHTVSYTTPSGAVWGPFNDNFRRRFVTMTVQARNMGL